MMVHDRWHFVYTCFVIIGLASLLPWNFIITIKEYFDYKLRNTSMANATDNSTTQTQLQSMYLSFVSIASMVSNVIFQIVNVWLTAKISSTVRIVGSFVVMIAAMLCITALVWIETDSWQVVFLIITLALVFILNSSSSILGGACFGMGGLFPAKYTQGFMAGQGVGGVLAAVSSIIVLLFVKNQLTAGFAYFLFASLVLVASLFMYFLMRKSAFAKYQLEMAGRGAKAMATESGMDSPVYTDKASEAEGLAVRAPPGRADQQPDTTPSSDPPASGIRAHPIWLAACQVRVYALSVFSIFAVTLALFPAITAIIKPMHPVSPDTLWPDRLFVPIYCFLLFNVGDAAGRWVAGILRWPRQRSLLLPLFCAARVVFVALFLLCNVGKSERNLPTVFKSDVWPIAFMTVFSLSNGWFATLCMMYGPSLVTDPKLAETAGAVMSFFLTAGLAIGSCFSYLMFIVA